MREVEKNLSRWYQEVKNDYLKSLREPENNPVKKSFILCPDEYVNVLTARQGDTVATKVIAVNDATGEISSITTLFYRGQLHVIDSAKLTALRCAFMAVMVIENAQMQNQSLAILGMGKIGSMVRKVIHAFYPDTDITSYGRHYDGGIFERVVIACTNNLDLNSRYGISSFNAARLFISFDGGYTLGESIRAGCNRFYADNVSQIEEHWQQEFPGETEFPLIRELNSLIGIKGTMRYFVSLYGCAITDLTIAKLFIKDSCLKEYLSK